MICPAFSDQCPMSNDCESIIQQYCETCYALAITQQCQCCGSEMLLILNIISLNEIISNPMLTCMWDVFDIVL